MKQTILLLLCLVSLTRAIGQGNALDTTFGNHGKISATIGSYTGDDGYAVTAQADGKIIVAGSSAIVSQYSRMAMVRFTANGQVDSSFGTNGRVTLHFGTSNDNAEGRAVGIQKLSPQTPEKIILGGFDLEQASPNSLVLARYDLNGMPDATFGNAGVVKLPNAAFFNMKIDTIGNIFVGGGGSFGYGFGIYKFKPNGLLDSTFGVNGFNASLDSNWHCDNLAIVLQQDGKILTGGPAFMPAMFPNNDFGLMRYLPNGTPDSSFGVNGKVVTSPDTNDAELYSLAVQADGKILACGISDTGTGIHSIVIRYMQNGNLDSTWGDNGIVRTSFGSNQSWATSVLAQTDGKIYSVGYATPAGGRPYEFAIARYSADGTIDSTFGVNGRDTSNQEFYCVANAAAILPNLKVVAAGWSYPVPPSDNTDNFALMQYISGLALGVIDLSVVNHPVVYPNPISGSAKLSYELTKDEVVTLSLFDMTGKTVQTFFEREKRQSGKHIESLRLAPLPEGNYILRLSSSSGSYSLRTCIK